MVNVTEASASETLKESSLEAIGYICQDIVSVCIYCFDFVSLYDIVNTIIFYSYCH